AAGRRADGAHAGGARAWFARRTAATGRRRDLCEENCEGGDTYRLEQIRARDRLPDPRPFTVTGRMERGERRTAETAQLRTGGGKGDGRRSARRGAQRRLRRRCFAHHAAAAARQGRDGRTRGV